MIHDDPNAPAVFTPQAIAAINRAYDTAIAIINTEGHPSLGAQLAEHMMALARNGERDEQRLSELSVLAVLGREPVREGSRAMRERPATEV